MQCLARMLAYISTVDDPIEPVAPSLKPGSYSDNASLVMMPSIQVLPEFSSDGLDDTSELAHRIMLVYLLHLLDAIKTRKASRQIVTRPTQVVLPLSLNHGLFGNDGLYPESKISLETLFNRSSSESWGEYLSLVGAVIG